MESRSKKFLKDFSIYSIGNLGSKLITFLMVPLYTYFVTDPSDFGHYDLCMTFCLMALPFVTLQLREGSFRFLLSTKDLKRQQQIAAIAMRFILGSIFFVLSIALLVSEFTSVEYVWQTAFLLIPMSFYEIQSQTIRGLGDNKTFAAMSLCSSFGVGLFSILFVAAFKMGVNGIFLANTLSRLVAILMAEYRHPVLRTVWHVSHIDKNLAIEIIKFSLPLIPTAVCWWITLSSNKYFIQYYCGLEQTGSYAVATKFSNIIQTLSIIFYQTWQETAITQYHSKDKDKFFSKIFNVYIFALALLLFSYTFFIKLNYHWLVGANYQDSSQYVYLLGVATALYAISAFFELGYQCSKETKRALPSVIATAVICLLLNWLLVPYKGAYGAIAASIACYMFLIVYRWFETRRRYYHIQLYFQTLIPIVLVIVSSLAYAYIESVPLSIVYILFAIIVTTAFIPRFLLKKIINKVGAVIKVSSIK